jgi:signal transduction histidine kinase
MEPQPVDPRWPKLMSLAVHEFRTPLTVVAGYIRMLLKDRAGPLGEQQRRLLEEAEESCARLAEMSDLGALERGDATFNRSQIDLRDLLREAAAALRDIPDREVSIEVTTGEGPAVMRGDPVRLRAAFASLFHGLRRELVTSPRLLVRESVRENGAGGQAWIAIGDEEHIAPLEAAATDALTTFDEWRGGCGLSLANARRVIEAHGGFIWSPRDESKAAAAIEFPAS